MNLTKRLATKYNVKAAAVKIPSYSDPIYKKEFKFPKMNFAVTPTSGSSEAAKAVIYLFPEWTKEDHLAAARKHTKDAEKLKKEWGKVQEKAHMKTFGKKPEFGDYKISGVGSDKYPEDMKNKLRELAYGSGNAGALAAAHKKAATIVNKMKNKYRQPVG